MKEAALRRMAQVKKDHLDEIHHLEESLLQKHTEHELKLKKTLMEKKLHSLNEHEKQRLENHLAIYSHIELIICNSY